MSWQQFLAGPFYTPRETFTTLPFELQNMVLHLLPFEDVVTMATVCRGIRAVALNERSLWRELPPATVYNVYKLFPFLDRAGSLGTSLRIDGIPQNMLDYLAQIVQAAGPAVRRLSLEFESSHQLDLFGMSGVMEAIVLHYPVLEHLELSSSDYRAPLGVIPYIPMTIPPFPQLVSLDLTAYSLVAASPVFANVEEVTTSIAALCFSPQTIFPPVDSWANTWVHVKFPAIVTLRLVGIERGSTGDLNAYTLRRLPFIDDFLDELELVFEPAATDFEDPETVFWIEQSARNVRHLSVEHNNCFGVRDAALMSLSGAQSLMLGIWGYGDGYSKIAVIDPATSRRRTAIFHDGDPQAHLTNIFTSPAMRVTELYVWKASWLVHMLPLCARYGRLEMLGLFYQDGPPFPDIPAGPAALGTVRTLFYGSETPVQVDAAEILAFTSVVVPRITKLLLTDSVTLLHPYLLPHTVSVGRWRLKIPACPFLSLTPHSLHLFLCCSRPSPRWHGEMLQ